MGIIVISVGLCGILRLIFVIRIYYRTYDMTWESYWAWVWLVAEANFAVICASAPALKTFFQHTFEGVALSSSGHKKSGSDIEGSGILTEKSLPYPSPSHKRFCSFSTVEAVEQSEVQEGKKIREKRSGPQEQAFF